MVTDGSAASGLQLRAVFAIKSDSSEVLESIEVEMEAANDGMYRVSTGSADALTTWLKPRFVQLMLGHLAIERVEGLSDGSVTIQIANTSMGESLKGSDDEAENIADTADRLSQTLVSIKGLAGRSLSKVGFRDMNGEGRLLSEFHGKTVPASCLGHLVRSLCSRHARDSRRWRNGIGDQGLLVINLSDESSADVVENWLAANPTDMMHGRVENFAFIAGDTDTDDHDMLRVRPVYIILDREGNVRAQRVGGGSIQMKIVQGPRRSEDFNNLRCALSIGVGASSSLDPSSFENVP